MKKVIINYLDELFPNPKCELNYSNDYELLIAVMLSAQTKDSMVNKVTDVLFKQYPTLNHLSKANINDIIKIIKPIGTYNKKASNIISIANKLISDANGIVPNDRKFLESLDGVGHKTANVVLAILFDEECFAVDTHVSRVSKRLKIASDKDSFINIENKLLKYFKGYNINRLHHQVVLFGRYYCKSVKPLCDNCKLKNVCTKNT